MTGMTVDTTVQPAGPAPIRVLLVDDQPFVRAGLRLRFGIEPDFQVVGEAPDGLSGLSMAEALRPDVIVMDVHMPHMSGIDATQHLTERAVRPAVILLSIHDDAHSRERAMRAGASAFVGKVADSSEPLLQAIRRFGRAVAEGRLTPSRMAA
jgi:DNA-binding NarL/FixJ family response regulator